MRTRFLLVALALTTACFVAPEDHSLGSAPRDSGSGPGDSGAGPERCITTINQGITVCSRLADPRVCGDVLCASGTQCCLTTGQCAASCEIMDAGSVTGGGDGRLCAAASDCEQDEYCYGLGGACFGAGRCIRADFCATCGSADQPERCAVCGCDGKTYASPQVACAAGVRSLSGACNDAVNPTGVCVNQSQCGAEAFCCARSGHCIRNDEAWRCEVLPDGGAPYQCRNDADCVGHSDYPWYTPPPMACIGEGCTGFGYCRVIGDSTGCTGLQKSVCGCDGQAYVNACWANSAGVRVAHEGTCP